MLSRLRCVLLGAHRPSKTYAFYDGSTLRSACKVCGCEMERRAGRRWTRVPNKVQLRLTGPASRVR